MAREFLSMNELDLAGATVLLRLDINSPVNPQTGDILDDTRMWRHVPTLQTLEDSRVIIMAHQGRPGSKDFSSLEPHARRLSDILGEHVVYVDSLVGSSMRKAVDKLRPGDKLLLENTRFYAEEVALKKETDFQNTVLVSKLSSVADVFVNDAFAAAHRAQPSLTGFVERMPCAAGLLMEKELEGISRASEPVEGESCAVLGGIKVDDSIHVMDNLLSNRVVKDVLCTGVVGNIALLAKGYDLGESNKIFLTKEVPDYEKMVEQMRSLLAKHGDSIHAPTDLALNVGGKREHIRLEELPAEHSIFDIGLDTIVRYSNMINGSEKVILNGPAGVFELPEFSEGTFELFRAMARCKGYTIMGGGHTNAVAEKLGIERKIDHISTGGGALIKYLSGDRMPVIEMLEKSKRLYDEGAYEK